MAHDSTSSNVSLSRERIVEEALALLDEEGEEALSMRRLAQRLGASTMSTYHHVSDKETLLDLVTDRVMSELRLPSHDASWQDAVRTMAWSFRSLTHQHPAVFRLVLARPRPAGMLVTSANVRTVLIDRGLAPEFASTVFRCTVRFLLGSTLGEVGGFGGLGIDHHSEEAHQVFESGIEALISGFTQQLGTVRLRAAVPDDRDTIVDVVTRAYRGRGDDAGWTTESHLLGGQRTDPTEVDAAISAHDAVLIVAVDTADNILGCVRVDRSDGSERDGAHFGLFAVDPERQSGGIGALLLGAAEAQAREWRCPSLELEVLHQRDDLRAWYLRRGFEPTGETQPFPYGDERFGLPRRDDLYFDVFRKAL